MYASNSHSYTHLILALGIVREPTVWVFLTSQYPDIHDIGLPSVIDTAGTEAVDVHHCHGLRGHIHPLKLALSASKARQDIHGETNPAPSPHLHACMCP